MLRFAALAFSFFFTIPPLLAQEEPIRAESLKSPADSSLPNFVPGPPIAARISSFGTDTMDNLMKLWISGFHEQQPKIVIYLQSKTSMSVPAALTAGTAQLAPLSRELNPSEVEAFRVRHGYAPTEIAVALGSYRTPHAYGRTRLLRERCESDCEARSRSTRRHLVHHASSRGKRQITEWGEVGLTGDWSHRPIDLVGVLPPDGVPNFITWRVCNGGLLRDGIRGEKNGEPTSVLTRIVQDVAKDPNAIGYAGFHNRQPGTHPIQIADTAAGPFYEGTFDEVRSAVYPLTRFIYIYLDRPPDKPLDPLIRKFLSYILSLDGQRKVEEEGIFMPLPPRIAAQQRAKLE
jgi:phosphate transport system substrate-binding protein